MKVYLDNSATSWPKPPQVAEAITEFLTHSAASPGRSAHRMSIGAAREVFETRELIAQLFNVPDSERVIFTSNATQALNTAIYGVLKKGDHVITTTFEHNSTIRPLRKLENEGIVEVTIIGCNKEGAFDISELENSIRPNTRLVCAIHTSNVTGDVLPIASIGKICKTNGIVFLVDASQAAGIIPIDMQAENIDLLAFTGHKKLYGPTGIGGLCIANNQIAIQPLMQGGTGSRSESEYHPEFYPDMLEAGTLNTVGIVGLKAGINFVLSKGLDNIRQQQLQLANEFIDGLKTIQGITVYRGITHSSYISVVSINVNGKTPSDVALQLDTEFGIMVRSGLHCSPLTHRFLGTFPQGTVRLSFGLFNTTEDINYTLDALRKIVTR